jgi:demethylmenaquinone methyltransferase/2-methoxy-6-polyprenyl-1,4-benzoquinol methylase
MNAPESSALETSAPETRDAGGPADTTHFGFRDVPVAEKQKLVGEVFSSVAGKYDLMNDLMSLGIHRVWKRYFVATAQVRPGDRVLDLAGGTGDIAALLKDRVGETGELVLGDINGAMLRVGRDRMTDRGNVRGFEYVQCNAEKLPFPDASFDLVTIAFGLRNVTDKDAALREMHRVLKVGGQARVLEFSEVTAEWFKPIYDFHSFRILPRLGKLFADDSDSYQYLAESIRKHPPQDALNTMMETAGFERCGYRNLSAGIVAIHTGYRV